MATAAKKRHGTGTEPTGSPIKPANETLDVPSLSKSLDENMDMAVAVLIFLVQTYTNDSDKKFLETDFEPLFDNEALGKICFNVYMYTQCWRLLLQALEQTISLADPNFPLGDFITDMLKIERSPKTTTFLTELQMCQPNIDDMQPSKVVCSKQRMIIQLWTEKHK